MTHLLSKKETFQRGELTRQIENLSHGRYLLIEVAAFDSHGKGIHAVPPTGMGHHFNLFLRMAIVEPEDLHCVNKLQETWNRIRELPEELNAETLEARGSAVRA
jgi:hypothetical protein